ncbi:MAG: hypothetical protein ABIL07_07695 [candidate division WOR-3 bacterium]
MNYRSILVILFCVLFLLSACKNHIIERTASEYFPMKEGNWWNYTNDDLYNPISINIKTEAPDTILHRECYPFNVSGEFHYYSKDQEGIKEYIKIIKNYGGSDYTILEGFISRLELPLVSGNRFVDSLVDSLNFFGQWIKVRYIINALVSEYQQDEIYGEVYRVVINRYQSVITQDSTISKEEYVEEYYAPGIGMIEFKNSAGRFRLKDFNIE